MELHETCKCKCRLDASVCNDKQKWNEDKSRCESKELIDKETFNKESILNPSSCECECDKSCDIGEYLDYKNCECRNKTVDKLTEKCSENIDENEMLYNETSNATSLNAIPLNSKTRNSCTIYKVLFVIFVIISIALELFLFIFIGILKKIIFLLNSILVLKQQFIEYT